MNWYGNAIDADDYYNVHAVHKLWDVCSRLRLSTIRYLHFSVELWGSSVTSVESFQFGVETIIIALQSNSSLKTIGISMDVLAAIGESDQERLFCSVGNLPTLERMSVFSTPELSTFIHTRVLADALSQTSNGIKKMELFGLKISSRSEVEQLARGLKARVESLDTLMLDGIVLNVEDKTGFLDPILLALAPVPAGEPRGQLSRFRFSCVEAASNGESVVSPEALGAFFAAEPVERPMRAFCLRNLGLNDSHCEVMAQELARDDALLRPIGKLDLTGNPSIGQQGYAALLGLLNRRFDICVVKVDDHNWKTTFALVVYMNRKCHRGRFMKNGVFPSKAMWVNFLAEHTRTSSHWNLNLNKENLDEARKLNAIWYTLREDPDLICT
jgi:hypothetical protein